MGEKLELKLQNIPVNLSDVANANVIPRDLYNELVMLKAWKDESQNSYVLVS